MGDIAGASAIVTPIQAKIRARSVAVYISLVIASASAAADAAPAACSIRAMIYVITLLARVHGTKEIMK